MREWNGQRQKNSELRSMYKDIALRLLSYRSKNILANYMPDKFSPSTEPTQTAPPLAETERVHMKALLLKWFDIDTAAWADEHGDESKLIHFYRATNNQIFQQLKFDNWRSIVSDDAVKKNSHFASLSPLDSNRKLKNKIKQLKRYYNDFLEGFEHGRSSTC